jgi:hypothetical protein
MSLDPRLLSRWSMIDDPRFQPPRSQSNLTSKSELTSLGFVENTSARHL